MQNFGRGASPTPKQKKLKTARKCIVSDFVHFPAVFLTFFLLLRDGEACRHGALTVLIKTINNWNALRALNEPIFYQLKLM